MSMGLFPGVTSGDPLCVRMRAERASCSSPLDIHGTEPMQATPGRSLTSYQHHVVEEYFRVASMKAQAGLLGAFRKSERKGKNFSLKN